MQARGTVLLNNKAMARLLLHFGGRLGSLFETAFTLVLFQGHDGSHCKTSLCVCVSASSRISAVKSSFSSMSLVYPARDPSVLTGPSGCQQIQMRRCETKDV